jgi:hypothetical protein
VLAPTGTVTMRTPEVEVVSIAIAFDGTVTMSAITIKNAMPVGISLDFIKPPDS